VSLLDYATDEYSQNGDDGIIERIFSVISDAPGLCCEFGAWDGIHFSNTRALILRGWRAVMIEADPEKFRQLEANYRENDRVVCVRRMVGEGPNSLDAILADNRVGDRLDFLSIDVDGLDYFILESLEVRPVCIAVEVNAGHAPESRELIPREIAAQNVGQPLGAFVELAGDRDYRLIAYNGNAYFLHEEAGGRTELPTVDPVVAYEDFLKRAEADARRWLFRVNLGLAPPYRRFGNRHLTRQALGLSLGEAMAGGLRGAVGRVIDGVRS
jgi:hypothetical protein